MQADFLRRAFIAQHKNSLYIDWPHRSVNSARLLAQDKFMSGKSLLATRFIREDTQQRHWNGFTFNNAESDISNCFKIVLGKIMNTICRKVSSNAWALTGPGVWMML